MRIPTHERLSRRGTVAYLGLPHHFDVDMRPRVSEDVFWDYGLLYLFKLYSTTRVVLILLGIIQKLFWSLANLDPTS
jgi:hypothetical protein